MNAAPLIARDELRLMRRNRVAVIACVLLVLLTLVAVASSWSHQRGIEDLRARATSTKPSRPSICSRTGIRIAWSTTAHSSSAR
jgi:hypothetical protein